MDTLLAVRDVGLTNRAPAFESGAVDLDPEQAHVGLIIPRPSSLEPNPDWDEATTVRVTVFVDLDGVVTSTSYEITGGVRKRQHHGGLEVEAFQAAWELPHGFFSTDKARTAADFAKLRMMRMGEQRKSSFRCWYTVERLKGNPVLVRPELVGLVAAEDKAERYHRSIALENGTASAEDGGDGVITISSFTANAGSNRVAHVVGGLDMSVAPSSWSAMTYDGVAVTRTMDNAVSSFSRILLGYVKDSTIGSGAKDIVSTVGVATDGGSVCAVQILSGVDQTTPVGTAQEAHGDSGSPTCTVTSVNATDLLLDGYYSWTAPSTIGANQTERQATNAGSNYVKISSQAGSDGGVMSWTGSGAEFSYGAVAYKEAAGGAAVPTIAEYEGHQSVPGAYQMRRQAVAY